MNKKRKMISLNNERMPMLDAVRFAANSLVVAIHFMILAGGACQVDWEYLFWKWISQVFAPIAMPTLFFISGYLFYVGNGYFGKLRRCIGRLVVPYLLWNLIVGVLFVMLCVLGINKAASANLNSATELWAWLIRKTMSLWSAPADMPTWYIRSILVYYVLSPVWLFFMRGKYRAIRLAVLAFGASSFEYYLCETGHAVDFLYTYPPYSLLCFCAGGAVAVSGLGLSGLYGKWRFVLLAIGISALVIGVSVPCPSGLACWIKLCEVVILFAVAPELMKVYSYLPEFVRASSFWLYVIHLPIFLMLSGVISRLPFNSTTLRLLTGIIVMLVIGLGSFVLVRKLTPRISQALNGRLRT